MRNLTDDEKISYILIGIAIGIGAGFMIKTWLDTISFLQTIGGHI